MWIQQFCKWKHQKMTIKSTSRIRKTWVETPKWFLLSSIAKKNKRSRSSVSEIIQWSVRIQWPPTDESCVVLKKVRSVATRTVRRHVHVFRRVRIDTLSKSLSLCGVTFIQCRSEEQNPVVWVKQQREESSAKRDNLPFKSVVNAFQTYLTLFFRC